jgi:hypothetical protein
MTPVRSEAYGQSSDRYDTDEHPLSGRGPSLMNVGNGREADGQLVDDLRSASPLGPDVGWTEVELLQRVDSRQGRRADRVQTLASGADLLADLLTPPDETAEGGQGLLADMVLDALGVAPGGLQAHAERAQKGFDDVVALAGA